MKIHSITLSKKCHKKIPLSNELSVQTREVFSCMKLCGKAGYSIKLVSRGFLKILKPFILLGSRAFVYISPFSFQFHQGKNFYPFPFCISSAFLVKTSPLLARKFLVQTVLFSVFIPEKIKKIKAIGKDSSSRKEKKKVKIC